MRLDAALRVAARGIDVALHVRSGSTLALLGPNGAGKSTVLEAIAGMVAVEGTMSLGERRLLEGRHGEPAHRRRIAIVTQDPALLPSLSVRDNVGFGPRSRGMSRADSRAEADRWLAAVDAAPLASRRVQALSGGQARRVEIARALATGPELLLLDEPFSALDMDVATAMRALVREVLTERTAVLATHEVLDAHALADDVAVLDSGRVIEHGPTARVLTRPRTAYAARMAGRSLLIGTWRGDVLELPDGARVAATPHPEAAPVDGAPAAIAARPRDVVLAGTASPGAVPDVVRAIEPHGDGVRVRGDRLATDVDPEQAASLTTGSRIAFDLMSRPLQAYALT
ncbi:ABC transporter ATP-binding protein [Demequina capsici]|uniref:ATP-binding cassette domain-containing protein n=1 Tax=Demequina capsici TaxID=3075620 RepID=A0AA96F7Y0_9MICO|nr:ATP-binding cassette domain-containing protein [Demequina sp. OYTSA14]WNM25458.1 ATP-binding cassette domain-containing protein [Demequina sp. OYTSA14]